MKQIGMYHMSFTAAQREQITAAAQQNGYHVMDVENLAELKTCEAVVGYVHPDVVRELPQLRWLHLPSAGVEKWRDSLPEGAVLTHSVGVFGRAIGEHVVMTTLMLLRRARQYQMQQEGKLWRNAGEIRFIAGSKVTVIGLGDIGTTVATYFKTMGATVVGVKRTVTDLPACVDALYPTHQVEEAVKGADVVVACLPYTTQTHQLIDRACIAAMGAQTLFINVGRGKTVDEDALVEALQAGKLAGAALDVTRIEPLPQESPLWEMDNVILTPHMSGHDEDALNTEGIFGVFYDNLCCYVQGEPLKKPVDWTRGY